MEVSRAFIGVDGQMFVPRSGGRKDYGEIRECEHCKKTFFALYRKVGKFCSNKCQTHLGNHPRWNGGKIISDLGYVLVKAPWHPYNRKGYYSQHRLIVEANIGRLLEPEEVVHHIDGNKLNNSIDNLSVMTQREHMMLHQMEKKSAEL